MPTSLSKLEALLCWGAKKRLFEELAKDTIVFLSKDKKDITIVSTGLTIDKRVIHNISVYQSTGSHIADGR